MTLLELTDQDILALEGAKTRIKHFMRQANEGIVNVGKALLEVRDILPHGEFGNWIKNNFNWSHDTANNFMNVARKFPTLPDGAEFEKSALYLLAKNSTPQQAREQAIQQAEQGIKITKGVAKILVDKVLEAQTKVIEEALETQSVSLGGESHSLIKGALTEQLCEGVLQRKEQIASHVERQADKDMLIGVLKNAVVSDARSEGDCFIFKLSANDIDDLKLFAEMYAQTAGTLRMTLIFKPDQPIVEIPAESESAA